MPMDRANVALQFGMHEGRFIMCGHGLQMVDEALDEPLDEDEDPSWTGWDQIRAFAHKKTAGHLFEAAQDTHTCQGVRRDFPCCAGDFDPFDTLMMEIGLERQAGALVWEMPGKREWPQWLVPHCGARPGSVRLHARPIGREMRPDCVHHGIACRSIEALRPHRLQSITLLILIDAKVCCHFLAAPVPLPALEFSSRVRIQHIQKFETWQSGNSNA